MPEEREKLKRERAGTYRTADGRFTVEQSSSGWLVLDAEETNELGLPLARGPFGTLDDAREALAAARTSPAPVAPARMARRRATGSTAKSAEGAQAAKLRSAATARQAPGDAVEARPDRGREPRRAPRRPDAASIQLRELRVADGDALRALWRACDFSTTGDDDRALGRLVRRNPGLVLVAVEGSRIVGSALGAWDGRRGWIYHVATAETHRRRGIASRLVDQVESGLRDLGCQKINVLVREANRDAAAFWTARGYGAGTGRQFGKELPAD